MGCSSRIQQIVGKGKQGAAEYIKTCRSPEILDEILDRILSHEISINDSESIDWIRWLMAGGKSPESFTAIVKKYHNASTCGHVWTAQSVAYRCRTCSLSPCMSLCAECFGNGDHDGHDYNMFRSQTGGACDCGDSSVMQCSGFCSKHGTSDVSNNLQPPPDLLYVAGLMAPRIFCRLILHLRNHHGRSQVTLDADDFLAMLCELSDMGAAMMRVLTSALTNPEVYRRLTRDWARDGSSLATYMASSERLYQEALRSSTNPEPPKEFENCPGLRQTLTHRTFLEELVFWTVKYEFPQKLINFLLIMLPEVKYKEALTEAFMLHYSRIAMILETTADPDLLSKRIAKISVQWFSNKKIAVKMTENSCLLEVMIVSLNNMMARISVPSNASSSPSERSHLVVDCKSSVLSQYRYWCFVSDLNSVFSYKTVALKFLNDESLMKMWFSFLSYFQGMNVNQRKLSQHVEYEQDTDSVFLAELWAVYPLSPLLSHLKEKTSSHLTKNLFRHCLAALKDWLESVMKDTMIEDQVSFHIPLHRSLAIFISHAVNVQEIDLAEVMPPDNLIRWILTHPLQIQAAFYEIINGVWAKNGLQIKKQASTYTQNDFCSSMVDADLYLLQLLGTKLSPNEMMIATIKQFKTKTWFLFEKSEDKDSPAEKDAILEGFLLFWATLCSNRTNLGNTLSQNIRMELATLSCLADRTHSQLMESLPERCGSNKSSEFDLILNEISDYNPPNLKYDGNMRQGIYTPKACVWNELYDPIHVMLRTGMNRKDLQNTINRYTDYLRKNKLLPATGTPWPPYRIPPVHDLYIDPRSMLNGRVFHALVWVILYKYVHENNVSENVLSLTIYLLELAVSIVAKNIETDQQEPLERIDVFEQDLENWFRSDCLVENVRLVVRNISCCSNPSSQTDLRVIEAKESILSLLLKCHSKLGGRDLLMNMDSSNLALENRIGDGPAFIEKVLVRIVLLSESCRTTVRNCHENLKDKTSSHESSKSEDTRKDHSEKKRKAEERRKRIMESLAKQREKFAKENESMLELGEDKMDWQFSDTPESSTDDVSNEKYYCGICRKMLTSTKENPIVFLAQVQATSVLGHRKTLVGTSSAEQKRNEMSVVKKEFSDWTDSITLGLEDGVYVQSCGHVFDHQCLIPEKKDEYSCPVCRQSANNVIPILPKECVAQVAENISELKQAKADITKYLEHVNVVFSNMKLFESVVNTSLQKIRNCLSPVHLSRYNLSEQSPCNMLFLASVARCNLEMDLMLRGGSLINPSQPDVCLVTKKSCMLPLFRLIGICARKLNRNAGLKIWRKLIGAETTSRKLSDKRNRKCMPILLRDPLTILLHLVLFTVPELPQDYYLLIVKILYTLVNCQTAVRLSYHMTEEQRSSLRQTPNENHDNSLKTWCFNYVMRLCVELLDSKSIRSTWPKELCESTWPKGPCDMSVEIGASSITFLRMASLLRMHLYKEPLPEIISSTEEEDCLLDYLQLTNRAPLDDSDFIKTWFAGFKCFLRSGNRQLAAAETLMSSDLKELWCQPKLLPLPYEYKDVFQNYQQKSCTVCQQVCQKISICLVCGTLVCLQEKCCERGGVYEAVRHAADCGSGTGIYLTVSSSNVIIIRGPKACIWGSMYLDVYGEEDPDLKRGKPLYLSSDRYHLLEHEWLSHNFNRIDDAWILHKDQL